MWLCKYILVLSQVLYDKSYMYILQLQSEKKYMVHKLMMYYKV